MNTQEIKKILVIKLCCIGDIIQTTPAIRALASDGAEVHFLCISYVEDIVDMIPEIKKKFIINLKNVKNIISLILTLRLEKYDLIVNFHRDLKSYFFTATLGAKYRAGFNWKGQGKFLTHEFLFDENTHESLRYLSIPLGLGFKKSGEETLINAPEMKNKKLDGNVKIGFFPGGGKNPGTTMPTKRWPVEYFVELANMFESNGARIYFFGGGIDRDVLEQVKSKISNLSLAITPDLKELGFYLSQLNLFIAGDTGPLHMAAALGVKTIGLFGPSSPILVGPRGDKNINLWEKTDCAPCYEPGMVHSGKFLECKNNICMKAIKPEKVKAITDKLLAISSITD